MQLFLWNLEKYLTKTQYSYHIIKVTERVDEQKSYDDVKDEIKSTLASQEYSKYIEKIEKNTKIEKSENVVKLAKF